MEILKRNIFDIYFYYMELYKGKYSKECFEHVKISFLLFDQPLSTCIPQMKSPSPMPLNDAALFSKLDSISISSILSIPNPKPQKKKKKPLKKSKRKEDL